MTALPRRRVLALLAALPPLLTACGSGSPAAGASGSPTAVDPDARARAAVGGALRSLQTAYAGLTPPHPALGTAVLTELQAFAGHTASASPSPSPSASATAALAQPVRAAAVATREQALARLCAAELQRTSPTLARLLASVAAGATLRATALGAKIHPDLTGLATPTASATASVSALTSASATATATASPSSGAGPGLEALQGALAAEHAAVYGYGVLVAQLDGKARRRAQSYYALHRSVRDALEARIAASGATPAAAAPGYRLPFAVADAASAARLAVTLEDRLAAVWADGVRAATGAQRREAAQQLTQAALRAQAWGGTLTAFPGLPERAASATR